MKTGYDAKEFSIGDLISAVSLATKQGWRMALAPSVAIVLLGLFLSVSLPSYYTSNGIIFVQPQRVSSKVVDSPKKDEMQESMEALVQEILSRPRLRGIIEQYKLYPDLKGVSGTEKALKKFRKAIEITPVLSPTGQTLLQTFELAFSYENPHITFEVTKAITNLFIEESILSKRSELQGTEEFLDGQLRETRQKLEKTEQEIQAFMTENFGKLPEHLKTGMAQFQTAQAQLATNSELISANIARRSHLQGELETVLRTPGLVSGSGDAGLSGDPQENLAQLEAALVVLKSKYSDKHPDVRSTMERIRLIRESAQSKPASGKPSSVGASAGSPAVLRLRREIKELDIQTEGLKEENNRLKDQIQTLQANIEQMPVIEQSFLKIKRDYDNIKATYERLLAAKEEAALQVSLLRSQKMTSFRVVNPPEFPVEPAGPMRALIAVGSVILGVGLFLSVILGAYFLNPSFKKRDQVESELGIKVIGTIPPLNTQEQVLAKSNLLKKSLITSGASLLLAGIIVVWAAL